MNRNVLMTGADYFGVEPLNPYSYGVDSVDRGLAAAQHSQLVQAIQNIGIEVVRKEPPRDCPDGVFAANWGFCYGDTAVLSKLPRPRNREMGCAEAALRELGKKIILAPHIFSGQGDTLQCGDIIFAGGGYRTDERMHGFLAKELGCRVIGLQALPLLDDSGRQIVNKVTGCRESNFYDIDIPLGILSDDLIAWCPEAFTGESQDRMSEFDDIRKIEVSLDETLNGLGPNLVSSGSAVVLSERAPNLISEVARYGLSVRTVDLSELAKGGGGIHCCALTLDN